MNNKIDFLRLPNTPGVYIMRDSAAKIIYIGKAKALRKRVASYFKNSPDMKTAGIISSLRHIDYILCASERDSLILERQLIHKYKPYYNSMWRDDKSYPQLKLTREDFPRLILTRKTLNDGSEYFGPYPNTAQMRSLVKWLRRIFMWRPCKLDFSENSLPAEHKIKSCLYLHTGRCPAPCAGKVTAKEYAANISKLKLFLKGKYRNLISLWKKEMQVASRNSEFEKAAELRDSVNALETMGQKVTFREIHAGDIAESLKTTSVLEEMKEKLNLPKLPVIIECFDISNTSGTDPVGSMSRFQNGVPDKNGYRKFKIRTITGIDDTAMIREIVFRRYKRLKEEQKQYPDLILIDGGPGQLNAAAQALDSLRTKIPVVSLAKQNEEIFSPGHSAPLKLERDSGVLHILQHVRDEAHRFAVTYHKLRRKKRMETQS
ncbi:MAG: excinuclease ABC subunit UvrC [Elusimicrobiota bacterium]